MVRLVTKPKAVATKPTVKPGSKVLVKPKVAGTKKEVAAPKTGTKLVAKLKGLSLKQMYNATPPYVRNNAKEVVIKKLVDAQTKGKLPALRGLAYSLNTKGPVHKFSIIGKDKDVELMSKQKHVLVDCDCGFFTFYCEYALHTWDSAVIKRSNGEPAVATNPGNQPLLCKHLTAAVREIMTHKL